ncbi:EI24 domain-containing protein [Frigidibacter sp. MR17.14]|uniref:EI24 domain-containing protein n=1 Tax=Frigidibacter sp. MR17.14 TaxID=3126509 RepID=UPI003012FDF6
MIAASVAAALGQIGDPRFLRVLLTGIGLALALLLAITWGLMGLVGWLVPGTVTLWYWGEVTWVQDVLEWGVVPLMLAASVFLMVPVASAFTGFFLDTVAEAVEEKHYPDLPPAPGVGLATALRDSAGFLLLVFVINALALIAYLVAGPLGPLLFWAVNGWLLGREYMQMAAMRRIGPEGAARLRRRHPLTIWALGALMAVPLTVPLVNLTIPVIGAAAFTHLYHRLSRRDAARGLA